MNDDRNNAEMKCSSLVETKAQDKLFGDMTNIRRHRRRRRHSRNFMNQRPLFLRSE